MITYAGEEIETLYRDAQRYRFVIKHWNSLYKGKALHRFLEEDALRVGGVAACVDEVMRAHERMLELGVPFIPEEWLKKDKID